MPGKNGFTLIEIVIVILLIGVLGALFVPRLLQQHDSFKVEAAAEQIANHIRLAQSHAIAQHITHGVYFGTTTNNTYSVYSKWDSETDPIKNPLKPDRDLIIDFRPNQEYTDSQLEGVTIESTTFGGDYVTFNALGKPSSGGSILIQKGSSNQLRIGVATETGAVSVWTP